MAPCPFWVPAQPRPRPLLPTSRLSAGGEIASPQAGARRAGDRQPHLVPLDPNALRSRPLHTPSTPNPPPSGPQTLGPGVATCRTGPLNSPAGNLSVRAGGALYGAARALG